ncbi:unnamed protein product [Zymoseptoria tritici ST99CH_3D7]|uniref:Anaphase-promoting complex subunit 5 n=1 Tax=Zymoseptoria tritici (strain ST99CH_3D7) TaxID=1276538 RepID=A0A1X7S990_ZYMT9|nr:unnamed protein product [Zymoseptoria tritici ST99CH_3D7]
MPRFLTPARITLLVIIYLYQSDQVSTTSSRDVIYFIARRTALASEYDAGTVDDRNALCSSEIHSIAETLQQWSSRVPGRSMYDVLLQALWSLEGLDSLHTLISQLRRTTETRGLTDEETGCRPVTPSSPLGQFLRRSHVEFTRLQFADSQNLWKAFAAYRAPTFDEWGARNPEQCAEYLEKESSVDMLALSRISTLRVSESASDASAFDTDMLLGFTITQLQKLGARVPDDVKSRLETWIGHQADSGTQSLHFFMAYFEHWRAGQYNMALESLHRYFDYSLTSGSGGDNMKVFYQYALLHLSVLHADFECWDESVDAMNECIATARENQDSACLNYALSWLLHLRHAHPDQDHSSYGSISGVVGSGGGEQDEITFLKTKAREGKHWLLLSGTLLEEARFEMFSGGNASRAHEHIIQAMYLNTQHNLLSSASAASLFHGAGFDRLGQIHVASRDYESIDAIHKTHAPLADRVRASCRLAQTLASTGSYSKATGVLESITPDVQGVLKLEQRVQIFATLVQLRRELHRGNISAAEYHLAQIRPLRSTSDPEVVFEIHILEIELLLRQKRLEEALHKVTQRLSEVKRRGSDFAQRLHLHLLKARIFALGDQSPRAFTIALRAACTAGRHFLLGLLLEAIVVLGKILVDLTEFAAARDLLTSGLPHALESHDLYQTGRLFAILGEAHVGFAGFGCEAGSKEQKSQMRIAGGYFEKGRSAFQKVEDHNGQLDCLLMKSRVFGWEGDEASMQLADGIYTQLSLEESTVGSR